MTLNNDSTSTLGSASRQQVEALLSDVANTLPGRAWLPSANRYAQDTSGSFQEDLARGSIDPVDLAKYIAASGPVHCVDGWGFLGKAIQSLTRGAPHSALHLAYYAELRAASSLFAAEGIGIFNRHHYVIDSSGVACPITQQMSTHQMVWLVFQWWAADARAVDLLKMIVTPGGQELETWVEEFDRGGVAVGSNAVRWFEAWGVDLKMFTQDRVARNTASYLATAINPWGQLSAEQILDFLGQLWRPLEPTFGSRFDMLDRHLLRMILEDEFRGYSGIGARTRNGQQQFRNAAMAMLQGLGLSEAAMSDWLEFLTASREPETSQLIILAGNNSPLREATRVTEVIARAVLLLRLASGACARLLATTGLDRYSLDFWIEAIGSDCGIWAPGGQPTEFIDLWADIELELDEAGNLSPPPPRPELSLFDVWLGRSRSLSVLSECERASLWGLGF